MANKNNANTRHQKFKTELRAYHDSINRKNRYNLPKIAGKLNVFEAAFDNDEDEEESKEKESTIEFDRKIPNTTLCVLTKGNMQSIGNLEREPLTEFKYSFIEGTLGENNKIITCITDDGKIEYFDVENEVIQECVGAPAGAISTTSLGCGAKGDKNSEHHEIEYDKVKKDLMIPYLCGYRIKDMTTGKLRPKGIKHKKRK